MSAPLDVKAIRALDSGRADNLERIADAVPVLCDEVALQRDALMRWREMTGSDTPHAARAALERERKVAAAWKALARAEAVWDGQLDTAEHSAVTRAHEALRALGVDPEAP